MNVVIVGSSGIHGCIMINGVAETFFFPCLFWEIDIHLNISNSQVSRVTSVYIGLCLKSSRTCPQHKHQVLSLKKKKLYIESTWCYLTWSDSERLRYVLVTFEVTCSSAEEIIEVKTVCVSISNTKCDGCK